MYCCSARARAPFEHTGDGDVARAVLVGNDGEFARQAERSGAPVESRRSVNVWWFADQDLGLQQHQLMTNVR